MEKFNKIKAIIEDIELQAFKFYGRRNGAAGIRLRRAMQEIRIISQEIRYEITELKHANHHRKS